MTDGHHNGIHHQVEPPAPVPMDIEQFAQAVEHHLLSYDAFAVLGRTDDQLRIGLRGTEQTTHLRPLYAIYLRNPTQFDLIIRNFVSTLLGETPDRTINDFAALAERIYPMLKPITLLAMVHERDLPMLAYSDFLADLIVTYTIDEGQRITFISEEHLDRWEMSIADIHTHALNNLRKRTIEKIDYTSVGAGEQRIFIFNSGDGYDATRLLLTDTLDTWARELPGRLVIGIPNRDFLIAFSDANPEILQAIARQIQADSLSRDYGLTDQLFTLADGIVQEYVWE